MLGLARRLMGGQVVDQREIDYHRGFYDGAATIVNTPEKAADNLESAARAAYTLAALEELHAEEEETPYV